MEIYDITDDLRYIGYRCEIQEEKIECINIELQVTALDWLYVFGLLFVVFILGFQTGRVFN